ncbi:lipoprotein [Mycobacterium leprae Kyoto-2]|uniref:Putative lipoprotein LppK n=3 Tax=Mycobacterium leprae TaxID=1769 RepID=LPPK_MYCLE|nr:lipoprotein [Mycobacterium leprae]Q49803.1 RecName: Full=Putative lipoprotein LppK; Flags: Precursor [Mycobacterium leprae TN]CAR71410.1 probable lipoprotein [Mycobacterium leprae Br4923]AAA17217.1 B2126_F3_115 [Mycobacterium leprae]AWV47924.1 lipoprotein [Mycobacterium leprae]OAR20078.1 hypothetical protein A8144_12370 [Mycobacterium leprae 3125609]OAX70423.1 hypothetical protein A3216_12040 [Mycobacterium leprae 7935681]
MSRWTHRTFFIALSAIVTTAGFGSSGCAHGNSSTSESAVPSTFPGISSSITAPPATGLPAPEVLTNVLSRLADPNIPGIDKLPLIESATPDSAVTLDKFSNALRDNGYLPMTFTANNIAWSNKNPSDVLATISVNIAQTNNSVFSFPMEFTPFPPPQQSWQLSKRTADMLLEFGNSSGLTNPAPIKAPTPTPSH